MDQLYNIVKSLTKEELRAYKLFAQRQQVKGERKDVLLIDLVKQFESPEFDDKIFKKLYPGQTDKNAYYRLKNRLTEDIGKSLLSLKVQDDDWLLALHFLQLAEVFKSKLKFDLALLFLKKAESKALSLDMNELLDIIYTELINLSSEILSINPEEYIKKRSENQLIIHKIRKLDDVLAVVNHKLKLSQNIGNSDEKLINTLHQLIDDFSSDGELLKNKRFKIKFYNVVSKSLLHSKSYLKLEDFLKEQFEAFQKEGIFDKKNHDTKLQMLVFLANTLFKNNKYEESIRYLSVLEVAMNEYDELLKDKYNIFYHSTLVNNYSVLNPQKAIDILQSLIESDVIKNHPFYGLFVYMNLAICFFDIKEYHKSIKSLSKLFLQETFKKADQMLKLKTSVAELIIRLELNDPEFWNYRSLQVEKEFNSLLLNTPREYAFFSLLKLINSGEIKLALSGISNYIKLYADNNSENDLINYISWLKDKEIQLKKRI